MNLKMLRSWLILFHFQYFPMDKQMCTLEIESFGYTMSDLKFRWEDGPKSVQASEQFPSIKKYLILDICHIWFKQCAFYSEHNFQKYTLHCSWHTHTFISIYTIDLYGKFEFTLSFILCSKKATKIIFGQISNHRNLSERKKYKNFSCSESFSILLEPFWRQALWQQI